MSHSSNLPNFTEINGNSVYNGNNRGERAFFNRYSNFNMYRACPSSHRENVLQFVVLDTDDINFVDDLFQEFPDKYLIYEDVTNTWEPELLDEAIDDDYQDYPISNYSEVPFTDNQILANNYPNILPYYPNDYTTVPIQIPNDYTVYDLNDFKYVNAPIAWEITKGGSSNINIGVSDGKIMANDVELVGKVSFPPSGDPFANVNYDPCLIHTRHGTGSSVAIAAKGDNNHGVVGVCYNCQITGADYNFEALIELAQTGVDVINMSWTYYRAEPQVFVTTTQGEYWNNIIQEIVEDYGTILVASAGNNTYFDNSISIDNAPLIIRYGYPASFDNVISVSSVHHWYDLNNHPNSPWTTCYQSQQVLSHIEDSFGGAVRVDTDPPSPSTYACGNGGPGNSPTQARSHVFNEYVDILAPTHNHLVYGRLQYGFCPEDNLSLTKYGGGTSHSAPMVSGTIGLMLSEDNCLTADEVEDILKLSSKQVEHLSYNSPHIGLSGSGALQTGNSVAFVHEMNQLNGTVIIKNQTFNRYDLSAKRIQNNLVIEDVEFIGNSIAEFKSGNEINLLEDTLLEPGSNEAYVLLEVGTIDNSQCNVASKSVNKGRENSKKSKELRQIDIFPTLVANNVTIRNNVISKENELISAEIYDVFGVKVFELENTNKQKSTINLNSLKSGIYIVKVLDDNKTIIHTQKIIKK